MSIEFFMMVLLDCQLASMPEAVWLYEGWMELFTG